MSKISNESNSDLLNKLLEKEKNVGKVVNRFLRMKLKRRIKKYTGIKIK
jgi:hypothetical protein